MPLFVCDVCRHVENTARGHFWCKDDVSFSEDLRGKALCSKCMPNVYSDGSPNEEGGKWHGYFPRWEATKEFVQSRRSEFIYTSDVFGPRTEESEKEDAKEYGRR